MLSLIIIIVDQFFKTIAMHKLTSTFQRIILVLVAIFLAHIGSFAQEKIEQHTLENGLTVFLKENHISPEVFGLVVCKVGGKNDPADATGMAHYQEHMLFKGTDQLGTKDWEKEEPLIDEIVELYKELGATKEEKERLEIQQKINKKSVEAAQYAIPNEFDNVTKGMGGTGMNANTNMDRTVYFNTFPSNQIDKWLELQSHRFTKPVFRLFQSELEVVYEEKNRGNDNFIWPLIEEFNDNFYKVHPYGQQSVIGTTEHLKNPPLHKMIDYYNTYYVANNMALILVGDFNSDEVLPKIEEKFGQWRLGKVPEFPGYNEDEFNGREFVERKLSPVKLGLLGFRGPATNHPDEPALRVANEMLSNYDQTGFIDELVLDNDILAAEVFNWTQNDYGEIIVLFVPKIIGQKTASAEELVLQKLDSLKSGKFKDESLDARKKSIYRELKLNEEENGSLGNIIAEAFQSGMTLEEMQNYPSLIEAVTKEDVVRVANKYFGDNYLAFHSKMGFKKPEKISQPEFDPVATKTNEKSEYRKFLEKIPSSEMVPGYLDLKKELKPIKISQGRNLYHTKNEINDIYSMKIRFKAGEDQFPNLYYTANLMDYAGTEEYPVKEFKEKMSALGASYFIYFDDNYTTVEIEGVENQVVDATRLLFELITNPSADDEKIKNIYDGEKAERKIEESEVDIVANALKDYMLYGKESDYLDRPSLNEVKELKVANLLSDFKKATEYEVDVFYAGAISPSEIHKLLAEAFSTFGPTKNGDVPQDKKRTQYTQNEVFMVPMKKANQSKIYFFINGQPYEVEEDAYRMAFNTYFGGGFSGLVTQEIREYRSLAYASGAKYSAPKRAKNPSYFMGYVGTQSDKTLEALEVFNQLVRDMPEKRDRIDLIKDYLMLSALTGRPTFREKSEALLDMTYRGFEEDAVKYNQPKFERLTFDDILKFYQKNLKNQPMAIAIVGNTKVFDTGELEKYGKVSKLKTKDIFSK
jgi:zinc protease